MQNTDVWNFLLNNYWKCLIGNLIPLSIVCSNINKIIKPIIQNNNNNNHFLYLNKHTVDNARDWYPNDMRVRNWLFGCWKEVSRLFGFQEYDTPILERNELYLSILISGDTYNTNNNNNNDNNNNNNNTIFSLRNDLYPPLSRFLLHNPKRSFPIKWFTIGQCWNYHENTNNREREKFNWNMNIIGVPEIYAELELLSSIVSFFKKMNFSENQIVIHINSREIVKEMIRKKYSHSVYIYLMSILFFEKQQNIKDNDIFGEIRDDIMDIVNASLERVKNELGITSISYNKIIQLLSLSSTYGFGDWVEFGSISSYSATGLSFEILDKTGKFPYSIGCGGRFDNHLTKYGAKQHEIHPWVCFNINDMAILELLKVHKKWPEKMKTYKVEDEIIFSSDYLISTAITIATILRNKGRSVYLNQNGISQTDRLAGRVIFITPSTAENQRVTVKHTTSQQEEIVNLADL